MVVTGVGYGTPVRRRGWGRFRRNRLAQSGAAFLAVATLVSLATLPFSWHWYDLQELNQAVRQPPSLRPVVPYEHYADAPSTTARVAHAASSWLGHDDLGRSLLYRLFPAFLVSFAIALAAAGMSIVVGTTWGAVAALAGGRVDTAMMRVVDVLYGLPYILTVILLKIALTRPLTVLFAGHGRVADLAILVIAIGGVSWLTMARVIRGQVLTLRAQPFVEAARAIGAGRGYVLRKHLLPNLVGPIVVYATLVIPQAILQESFLSFLGIGVQQPVPSLGRLASNGVEAVNTFVDFWWLLVFPGGLLAATILALNLVGDGLGEAFDPKSTAAPLI